LLVNYTHYDEAHAHVPVRAYEEQGL
jgi:hypothetical protein